MLYSRILAAAGFALSFVFISDQALAWLSIYEATYSTADIDTQRLGTPYGNSPNRAKIYGVGIAHTKQRADQIAIERCRQLIAIESTNGHNTSASTCRRYVLNQIENFLLSNDGSETIHERECISVQKAVINRSFTTRQKRYNRVTIGGGDSARTECRSAGDEIANRSFESNFGYFLQFHDDLNFQLDTCRDPKSEICRNLYTNSATDGNGIFGSGIGPGFQEYPGAIELFCRYGNNVYTPDIDGRRDVGDSIPGAFTIGNGGTFCERTNNGGGGGGGGDGGHGPGGPRNENNEFSPQNSIPTPRIDFGLRNVTNIRHNTNCIATGAIIDNSVKLNFNQDTSIPKGTSNLHCDISCPVGYEGSPPNCQKCRGDEFSDHESRVCRPCANSNEVPEFDHSGCKTCPAGQIPDEFKTNCISCTGNTFSNAGDTECTECTAGQIANNYFFDPFDFEETINSNIECVKCEPTEYADAENARCVSCPGGHEVNENMDGCVPCAGGQIQGSDGMCQTCESGLEPSSQGFDCVRRCDNNQWISNSDDAVCREDCDDNDNNFYNSLTKQCECPSSRMGDDCSACAPGYVLDGDTCTSMCDTATEIYDPFHNECMELCTNDGYVNHETGECANCDGVLVTLSFSDNIRCTSLNEDTSTRTTENDCERAGWEIGYAEVDGMIGEFCQIPLTIAREVTVNAIGEQVFAGLKKYTNGCLLRGGNEIASNEDVIRCDEISGPNEEIPRCTTSQCPDEVFVNIMEDENGRNVIYSNNRIGDQTNRIEFPNNNNDNNNNNNNNDNNDNVTVPPENSNTAQNFAAASTDSEGPSSAGILIGAGGSAVALLLWSMISGDDDVYYGFTPHGSYSYSNGYDYYSYGGKFDGKVGNKEFYWTITKDHYGEINAGSGVYWNKDIFSLKFDSYVQNDEELEYSLDLKLKYENKFLDIIPSARGSWTALVNETDDHYRWDYSIGVSTNIKYYNWTISPMFYYGGNYLGNKNKGYSLYIESLHQLY